MTLKSLMRRAVLCYPYLYLSLTTLQYHTASSFTVTSKSSQLSSETHRSLRTKSSIYPPVCLRTEHANYHVSQSSLTSLRATYVSTDEDSTKTRGKRAGMNRLRRWRGRNKTDEEEPSSSSAIQMKFVGTKHVATPPMVVESITSDYDSKHEDIDQLLQGLMNEYFSNDDHRNLLFPNNNSVNYRGPITRELIETWCREAERGGATGPDIIENFDGTISLCNSNESVKEQIMQISTVLEMPSLHIKSESTIGVKLLLGSGGRTNENGRLFPEFQFTLLDSQLIPEGSKPAMWVFNQLIKFRDLTSSFTRVTVESAHEGNKMNAKGDHMKYNNGSNINDSSKRISFITDARLETRIHIPSAVMKILPSSFDVSKFEKSGSESVQKLLEKELEPALLAFCDSFHTFAMQCQQNTYQSEAEVGVLAP